jgi:hypothetical protein
MRLSHGHHAVRADDVRAEQPGSEPAGEPEFLAALGTHDEKQERDVLEEPPRLERWDLVQSRWSLGSALVLLAGAALGVLGVAAVARTGINATWFSPAEEVAGIRHTPLLAAIEAGVGLLLVIAGLAGAPGLAVFVCISAAMAAGVGAIEPDLIDGQLAAERWWLVALAVAGAGLAVLSMVPWPHFVERHYTREVATGRRRRRSVPRPGLVS